jgi:anti-anti-sigma factor
MSDDIEKKEEKSLEAMAEGASKRLKIRIKDDPKANRVTAFLEGRLDIFTYRALAEEVDATCKDRENVHLVVDLSEVPFVASSGWSAFIAVRGRLKRNQGRISLVGMNEDLKRVYFAMKLKDLIPAFATMAEAEAQHGSGD